MEFNRALESDFAASFLKRTTRYKRTEDGEIVEE